jgi:hypothetical protein
MVHLLISANLPWSILRQMVEELGILMHGPSTLLEVHEFLMLPSHDTRGDMMGVEGLTKLTPRHLIVRGASGGVVGPPRTCNAVQCSAGAQPWTQLREVSCWLPEALLPQ